MIIMLWKMVTQAKQWTSLCVCMIASTFAFADAATTVFFLFCCHFQVLLCWISRTDHQHHWMFMSIFGEIKFKCIHKISQHMCIEVCMKWAHWMQFWNQIQTHTHALAQTGPAYALHKMRDPQHFCLCTYKEVWHTRTFRDVVLQLCS